MYFIIAGILALVFVGALLVKLFVKDNRGNSSGGGVAAGALVLLIIFTLVMSATTVGARSVGIQTAFGKYTDTLDNGFHWTAPWSSVEEFSTQLQPLKLKVPVSFDGGSSGTAEVTVLYAIENNGAEELWKDFKTFDNVTDLLVKPYSQTEIAAAFSAYQPQDARDGGNRAEIQNVIKTALSGKDNDGGTLDNRGILIDSVQITGVTLGDRAQNSVDRIAEADANTERANSEQERATIEAETARIRQQTLTPEALTRYCLEVLNAWNVTENGSAPATLNCGLGSSNTPVIVNGG